MIIYEVKAVEGVPHTFYSSPVSSPYPLTGFIKKVTDLYVKRSQKPKGD